MRRAKKTRMKEEMRVRKGDIAFVVDGVGEDVFGVESSDGRRVVSKEDSV